MFRSNLYGMICYMAKMVRDPVRQKPELQGVDRIPRQISEWNSCLCQVLFYVTRPQRWSCSNFIFSDKFRSQAV